MSKMSASKVPGGRPLKTIVAPRRTTLSAWSNAWGARRSRARRACRRSRLDGLAGSVVAALTVTSAPWRRASSSLASSTSTAATRMPIARAYCTAM
jgi:hypothetical protein